MDLFNLAQLNIAQLVAPLDSPKLADFVANLERINRLADTTPGFVWRLQTDAGDATGIKDFGADFIVNLSVWRDLASLRNFVYRSQHAQIMRRRKEWFTRIPEAYTVLWWVPEGQLPDTAEARQRLELLVRQGPGVEAFTFSRPFPPPGSGMTGPVT